MCIRSLAVAFIALLSLGANVAVAELASTANFKAFAENGASLGPADAAHGFLVGNESAEGGDPLLTLLNKGTKGLVGTKWDGQTKLVIDGTATKIAVSDSGMFSTTNQGTLNPDGIPIWDLTEGNIVTPGAGKKWVFSGKTNSGEVDTGPFELFGDDLTAGTLTLSENLQPFDGPVVVSLKAGQDYSVYAFQNLSQASYFQFTELSNGLSHASLYTTALVPEPGSIGLLAMGLMGLTGVSRFRGSRRKAKQAS